MRDRRQPQPGNDGGAKVTLGWLVRRFAVLMTVALGGALLALLGLELQAGSAAYIVGESHWSKAQQTAVYHLSRYAYAGDPADLRAAHEALAVPLGDRAARLALERRPVDLDAARRGFLQGGNDPRDIDRLIRLYRYGAGLPYLRDSVRYWREADVGILQLQAFTDQLLDCHLRADCQVPQALPDIQPRLQALDTMLRAREVAFSRSLVEGARAVRIAALVLSLVGLMLLTGYAAMMARRIRDHMVTHESQFRAAFHQAAVGMAKFDLDGRLVEANEALARILGWPLPELRRRTLADLLDPDELGEGGGIDWTRHLRPGERRFRRVDGRRIWCSWSAARIAGGTSRPTRVLAVIDDVSQAHQHADEVAHQAAHDALTGLVNRREIEHRLSVALARLQEGEGPHCLCFVDLDHFKQINDTYGHPVGDRFLCHFADVVSAQLRAGDWLGRLGGDEFAIFLGQATLAQAPVVLERIGAALAQPWSPGEGLPPLVPSGSFGVVELQPGMDLQALTRAADLACYAAKEGGRNRVRYFDAVDIAQACQRADRGWAPQVAQAMEEGRMLLYAQRIEVEDDPAQLRYEVLVRLRDRDGQLHAPSEFLPSVERNGMGAALDRHVLGRLAELLDALPAHRARLARCHVNIAQQTLVQADMLVFLDGLFARYPWLPGRLCLEITEAAAIAEPEHARRFTEAVRARGCGVALDGFGCHRAAFGCLRYLTVDALKIDAALVRGLAEDPVDRAAVRSIARFGETLGIAVVAGYVEDGGETLAALRALGVRRLQGHALHRPCPLEELVDEVEVAAA